MQTLGLQRAVEKGDTLRVGLTILGLATVAILTAIFLNFWPGGFLTLMGFTVAGWLFEKWKTREANGSEVVVISGFMYTLMVAFLWSAGALTWLVKWAISVL